MSDTQIKIPESEWDSPLVNLIFELEKLRYKRPSSKVPTHVFSQLKTIFHILETLGSARIEGNQTTLSEYVENIIERTAYQDKKQKQKEIENIEDAINFIEENTDENSTFSKLHLLEIHKIVTEGLDPPPKGEGSKSPGRLRMGNVTIVKSPHKPPDYAVLQDYFDKFLNFINDNHIKQNQLLMIAIAHHRFNYIHPFDNGNGRVSRLLNYALLIKFGFKVSNGRIINPSAVFYTDRKIYYDKLAKADSLQDSSVLQWAEYFLSGLKNEIEKIDNLLDVKYVQQKILLPAVSFSFSRQYITKKETEILTYLINKPDMSIKAKDLSALHIEGSLQKSRTIIALRNKNILNPIKVGGRIYTINFTNNYLLRGVVNSLEKEGFVSEFLNKN